MNGQLSHPSWTNCWVVLISEQDMQALSLLWVTSVGTTWSATSSLAIAVLESNLGLAGSCFVCVLPNVHTTNDKDS
ncbi:unnamed protein product [Chondrus crispus]|uniref:Uncharacterized protein n=1 Tax=Chondrus crispus TaxID=2769 RepID=R7QUF1_CHOCR|nr:unnamed protein product [Chondrus crispus]CDF41313.1 unnamed protein product [Chondrus crispus]|eukprot:XP_005711607.1 unnamed protein product [Chondrus crispus]